jgi:hypothetical protein
VAGLPSPGKGPDAEKIVIFQIDMSSHPSFDSAPSLGPVLLGGLERVLKAKGRKNFPEPPEARKIFILRPFSAPYCVI